MRLEGQIKKLRQANLQSETYSNPTESKNLQKITTKKYKWKNRPIGLVGRVFANSPGDLGSIYVHVQVEIIYMHMCICKCTALYIWVCVRIYNWIYVSIKIMYKWD